MTSFGPFAVLPSIVAIGALRLQAYASSGRGREPLNRRYFRPIVREVSGGIDLVATEPAEFLAHNGVMCRQGIPPGPVTEASGQLCRPHDVRKQHCRP